MKGDVSITLVIEKLNAGMKFGLFGDGTRCHFRDGTKVRYSELWSAVKSIHGLENGHSKTLAELYPDTYVGSYSYGYLWHNWKRANTQKIAES